MWYSSLGPRDLLNKRFSCVLEVKFSPFSPRGMNSLRVEMLVLVGVLWPLVVMAQRTPSISYITQEQIKDIGGTVEMECSVQYAKEYSVHWIKTGRDRSDVVFLSTGSALVLKDSRFALRFDPSSSSYILQIKDIQETDAGIYQCQVVLSVTNKITADVELQVRRPPIISDNSTQSLVASEGEAVMMECYASGYPPPQITWRRENNAILPTGQYKTRGSSRLFARELRRETMPRDSGKGERGFVRR